MVWKQRQEEEPVEEQPCWRLLLSSVSAGFGLAPGRRAYWLLALRLLNTDQFMKLKVGSRIIHFSVFYCFLNSWSFLTAVIKSNQVCQ